MNPRFLLTDMLETVVLDNSAKNLTRHKWEAHLDKGKCIMSSSNKSV